MGGGLPAVGIANPRAPLWGWCKPWSVPGETSSLGLQVYKATRGQANTTYPSCHQACATSWDQEFADQNDCRGWALRSGLLPRNSPPILSLQDRL